MKEPHTLTPAEKAFAALCVLALGSCVTGGMAIDAHRPGLGGAFGLIAIVLLGMAVAATIGGRRDK